MELDQTIVKGREVAQQLHRREKAFQGPMAVEVDDENRVYRIEYPRRRLQVFRKQIAIFEGVSSNPYLSRVQRLSKWEILI